MLDKLVLIFLLETCQSYPVLVMILSTALAYTWRFNTEITDHRN